LGIDPSDLQDVVAEVKQNRALRQRKAVADDFVVKHPDFLDNVRNGQRLAKAIALYGDFTLENFEKAYQDLSESGLLEVKGEEASAEQKKAEAEAQRIADAAETTSSQRTRKASGISTHRAVAVPRAAEPTEDDMYSMSLDELRKRAEKQLAG
jgi:DNA-binding helix-hairpin-helix protein with protein kinase domain